MLKLIFWGLRGACALYRRIAARVVTLLHRATLTRVGHGTRFQSGVRFDRPSAVVIGDNCLFWRGVGAPAEGDCASLRIGDRVQVNQGAQLDMTGGLTIENDVLISEDAVLYTHDHGLAPHSVPHPMPKVIGAGAWVGMRAVILPQCQKIGAGAVIGAGAIVTRDVPAGAIFAGNPARQVGSRSVTQVAA